MICDWDVQTFDYWLDVLKGESRNPKLPKSGLKVCWQQLKMNDILC